MDLFSAAANAISIAGAVSPLFRRGAPERAFHECLGRAMRRGFAEQGLEADSGASASLVADALRASRAYGRLASSSDDLARSDRVTIWAAVLEEEIPALGVIDERIVDLPQLAQDTARLLALEVDRAAREPGSALAIPLLLSQTAPKSPDRGPRDVPAGLMSPFARTSAGVLTNLTTLPLREQPVSRPEENDVYEALAAHGMAVISGGPGVGKSVLAETVARSRSDDQSLDLIWLVRSSTAQQRLDACETLLLEFGERPGDDPLAQVRSLLAHSEGWLIVADDVPDLDAIREIIPAAHPNGSVVVTARSATSFPRPTIVELDIADESTLREIARRRLPEEISESEIGRILDACAGNPLIVSTACSYVADTGTSVAALLLHMGSHPTRVLAGRSSTGGFVSVLDGVRTDARNILTWRLLVAVAVSGGSGVPRRLFEIAFDSGRGVGMDAGLDSGIQCDDAFAELMSLGIVRVRGGLVESHALTAAVTSDLADDSLRALSAARVMEAVTDLVSTPGRRLLPGLAPVIEAASPELDENDPARVMTRVLLAERLSEQGLIHAAHRQLQEARRVSYVAKRNAARLAIVNSEARVQLFSGEPALATKSAELVVSDPTVLDEAKAAA